jgi:DNA-binding transcriptional regulator YdaS (Cro superfamily)
MTESPTPLELAIERVGGSSELARILGITPAAISQWERVPPNRVLAVESASGVSRYDLRPDVFGIAPDVWEPVE